MNESKMKDSKEFYEKTKNNIVNKELRYFVTSVEHRILYHFAKMKIFKIYGQE